MTKYRLRYFDARGWAEVSRQLFKLADVEFEDIRTTFEEWPAMKDSTPFGKLPLLEVDGKILVQSWAIARYLAKEFGYAGKNKWEEAWVDAIADQLKDYLLQEAKDYFMAVRFGEKPEEIEEKKQTVLIPARNRFFKFLVDKLKESGSGYLMPSGLTWADLLIAEHIFTMSKLWPQSTEGFQELEDLKTRVYSHPKLKEWIEKRPDTAF
ncbi:hypothetical protein WR25_25038 [Diploscapter pachys]|uniref:glutathione transferase n=1 Tax=Diploscapter pachys TaxID=2018661 RepID=A0A2A2JKP7_9BILA|nr:hypothetical protein WR25_25038 [Diploscapter pachys]